MPDGGPGPDELVQPISPDGSWLTGPPLPIDYAHRRAALHRGVWLFVLTAAADVLVVQRSAQMVTCPSKLSVIGEHHLGREEDEDCAVRAMREELLLPSPAALGATLYRLRRMPRWFSFDYGGGRYDHCLVSEFVLQLPHNRSAAAALLARASDEEAVSTRSLLPLRDFGARLRDDPGAFCAAPLFPSCLLDSVADLCERLRSDAGRSRGGRAPEGCLGVPSVRRGARRSPACPVEYTPNTPARSSA